MPSIREAIEALAVELEMGDVVASTFYVEGCNDEAQRIAVRLRAILAAPEPSREELREKIIEIVGGLPYPTRAADRILALLPDDLADATLPLMPTSKRTVVLSEETIQAIVEVPDRLGGQDRYAYIEGMKRMAFIVRQRLLSLSRAPSKPEEPLREAFVEGAEWADMHDCGGISTEESQEAIRAAALRRHPLDWCERARESAPAKDGRIVGRCVHDYEPVTCDGECSTKCPFIVNGWLPNPAPAKDAEPALGLNIVEDSPMPEDVIAAVTKDEQGNVTQRVFIKNVADPAAPQFLTMTQPKIDFVLDLSQAEADRLGPPAPKVWRCETCGRIVDGDELCEPNLDYGEFHHLDIRGMPCGPVEEQP
jgi:DNA-directed RNA polymerase subunit F